MDYRRLDEVFPTVVRYCGMALTVVLVFGSLLGHGVELAAGYVAAAGMILYKTVRDAANGQNSSGQDPAAAPDDDAVEERWSHLP